MATVVGRADELSVVETFLDLAASGPRSLRLEGAPGIGKTTVLQHAARTARDRGCRVLTCSGTAAETRLAYSALADVLGGVDAAAVAQLPPVQRRALDAALLRGTTSTPAVADAGLRAVSVAALSVLEWLCARHRVVVAVDDMQWLDAPSRRVLDFCARRLPPGAGLIAAWRTDDVVPAGPAPSAGSGTTHADLAPSRTVVLPALGQDDLRRLVRGRSPTPLDRRVLHRIVAVAGGNPLYALELLRGARDGASAPTLTPSLREIVAARTDDLGDDERRALLVVAAMPRPSLSALARVLGTDALELLAEAEHRGVVVIDGDDVGFTHPLLAEGVYSRATSAARRQVHRLLAAVTVDLEERARHLAAARVLPDALDALQAAAGHLRGRGAPDAAAEMLELAVGLGAAPRLLVQAAEHRFDAGDTRVAVRMLEESVRTMPAGTERAAALLLLGEMRYKDDSFPAGHALLEQAQHEADGDLRLLLMADLRLAFTLYNLGEFPRAAEAGRSAVERAGRLGDDALTAQALAVSTIVDFSLGFGFDEDRLVRALRLQDPAARTGAELYPGLIAAFLYFWNGRLEESRRQLDALREQYLGRGEEQALAWASFVRVWLESASGDAASTARAAAEAHDRLMPLETVTGRALALAARGEAEAYAGRDLEARGSCAASLALFEQSGWMTWSWFPRMTLGALELASGRPAAAAAALEPVVRLFCESGFQDPSPGGLLFAGDAVEALVATGRTAEAELIVDRLEEGGRRLRRRWAVVVGARCRGLLLAAAGDLDGASRALERAVEEDKTLAMPRERARNLLALGRVRRAQRRRRDAREVLGRAHDVFAAVGAAPWVLRVDEERARLGSPSAEPGALTASELRVARLVADGLTNRQVAASLVISPKTVEAHLSRAYGKLGVHSRVQLCALLGPGTDPEGAGHPEWSST